MARLTPEKGIETFLDAVSIVHGSFPQAYFVIVGDLFSPTHDNKVKRDITYRDALIKKAESMGIGAHVIFSGYRSDVPELLSQATLLVSASYSEGLPNVLMESMAAGVPVVATRVGGSPEVVGENGVAGLLVPPRDVEALAKAICTLLDDPDLSRRLGEAARERMTTLFSVERMVNETEYLYTTMLEQATKRRHD
jgi:glycosyltransferase involved in cell wall biosynthesis